MFPLGATGGDHRTTSFDEELEYARMSTGIEGAGKKIIQQTNVDFRVNPLGATHGKS